MNTNNDASTQLFRDRQLPESVVPTKQTSDKNLYIHLDSASDRRTEFLDSLLQMSLAACLFISLAICAWNVGTMPNSVDQPATVTSAPALTAHDAVVASVPHPTGTTPASTGLF